MMKSFLGSLFLLMAVTAMGQEQLTIAAAADLQPVMQEIAARFEKTTGKHVILSFGSSGNFFTQIQNGAPFDLFFSADIEYPRKLEAAGLTAPGSLYRYATGKIAVWTRKASNIDLDQGLKVVGDSAVTKLAIANPAHAPYGRAAEAALRKSGLWEKVEKKLVLGENISQTAQFVESGNAEVGIIALSLALSPAMNNQGKYFIIPQELYPQLQQAGVILKSSRHLEIANRFMNFLKGAEAKALLKEYGFSLDGAQE